MPRMPRHWGQGPRISFQITEFRPPNPNYDEGNLSMQMSMDKTNDNTYGGSYMDHLSKV